MSETSTYLIRYFVTFFYGIGIVRIFAGIVPSKRNRLILLGITVALLLIQGAFFYITGIDGVINYYPLHTHALLAVFLVLLFHCSASHAVITVLLSYMGCQVCTWISKCIQYIFGLSDFAEVLAYTGVTLFTWFLFRKYVSSYVQKIIQDSRKAALALAIVPVTYYFFDYFTTVWTKVLYSGSYLVTQFMPFSICLAYIIFVILYCNEQMKKEEMLAEKTARTEIFLNQATTALALAVDAKDKYTNGHSIRVAEYARMISKRLGQSEEEQQKIYYMGLMHDVGKIGIPDTIINKPGKLTTEERAEIEKHPEKGYEILRTITAMPELSMGALFHHERYDGLGYPQKIAGEKIPLEARIIGVADSYDAMTSKRSYRDVLPQEKVRREIDEGKGKQFDPLAADVMLTLIDEDTEYRMREQ